MSDSEFKRMVAKANEITRDDLATFLCLTGWTALDNVGRKFTLECETCIVTFDLGTCGHLNCFLRDLLKYMEIREIIEVPTMSLIQLVRHVKEEVKRLHTEEVLPEVRPLEM